LKDGLEANRKICLRQQTELRNKLHSTDQYQEAFNLFFKQHAMLHSFAMARTEPFSLEDEVFEDLNEERARRIPGNSEHSIVWNIWHIARIEDVTMNILVAGSPQILNRGHWIRKLMVPFRDTGNAMGKLEIENLSNKIVIKALRSYRVAVGRKTSEIVKQLQFQDLKNKVDPARLEQVRKEGAVVEAASGLLDYWGRRNIAGLLLMPATRHNLVHLNESLRLKAKRS
jgi:hypothetical protein